MNLSSRKFIITLVMFLTTTVLCWFGKVDQSIYLTISGWIFTGYVLGNLGEYFIKKNGG